ncbi:hypothetical protein BBBOND_0208180 [Babesia bigemina]|uniref:Uncharacterized protein n=1 Tax=Babesia bigemina TaxID=5866 RepID=A0A061D9S1_BABBI|nr:hypothetical protein BBBOND_0208180 [Babesia bigemina]CDR95664.1 hypothetical protein BBBOND_0208180 [Babesia bigemina]|eukprot:XP_012767850.1 hypothetical protein BBBOND_0208180 [Babesia bigemina]
MLSLSLRARVGTCTADSEKKKTRETQTGEQAGNPGREHELQTRESDKRDAGRAKATAHAKASEYTDAGVRSNCFPYSNFSLMRSLPHNLRFNPKKHDSMQANRHVDEGDGKDGAITLKGVLFQET